MAGAAGYVLKQIRGTDLVGAVRTVASGQSCGPEGGERADGPAAGQVGQARPAGRPVDAGVRTWSDRGGPDEPAVGERMFLAEKTVTNWVWALSPS